MSRERGFCLYCGTVIEPRSTACVRHAHLTRRDPHLDGVPPDPLESLPMMGDELSCDKPVAAMPTEEKLSRPARSADSEAAHRPDRVSARKDRVTET